MKFVFPFLLLICWVIVSSIYPAYYFPSPDVVLNSFIEHFSSGEILKDTLSSGKRLFIGLFVGVLSGIVVGAFIGYYNQAHNFFMPTINGVMALPVIALFPIIIMIFGLKEISAIFIIAFSSFFPTFITAVDGIKAARKNYSTLIQNLELNTVTKFSRVLLPAAMPSILSGIELSINIAIKLLLISEMLGVPNGLGYRILESSEFLAYPKVYYHLVYIATWSAAISYSYIFLKNRILKWV